MKKTFVCINIVLVVFLGLKINNLKIKLDKSPPPVTLTSMVNVNTLSRPVIIKEFASRKIFDTKEPADIKVDKTGQQGLPGGLNEILDKDVILRLKGIIKSEELSFAVLDLIEKDKGKKNQIMKLLKGESFRGYLLGEIFKNYVSGRMRKGDNF